MYPNSKTPGLNWQQKGFAVESDTYISSIHRKSRSLRQGSLSLHRRSRRSVSQGNHGAARWETAERPATDTIIAQKRRCGRINSPSVTLGIRERRGPSSLGWHQSVLTQAPERPLMSRASTKSTNGAQSPCVGRPLRAVSFITAAGKFTALKVQRTQWFEEDGDGGRVFEGVEGTARGPDMNEGGPKVENEDDCGAAGEREASRWSTSAVPRPVVAWGESTREPSSTVSKATHMKDVKHRAKAFRLESKRRIARANRVRAELVEEEHRRAEELLYRRENRKQAAIAAATLEVCQRGLIEAIVLVVAAKNIWAAGLKLAIQREEETRQASVIQRAFKAYSSRRILRMLLSIRRVHMRFHIGVYIRRKRRAAEKIRWFLTIGGAGAATRPRQIVRAFMNRLRRSQRVAREWLICRAASIEALCRLWTRIEMEIRKDLSDELDRARRVWRKSILRAGQDSHIHGHWYKLKARTRSLIARIDWLEKEIEKQDKAHRTLAVKEVMKQRAGLERWGAPRAAKRLFLVDSVEDLRSSMIAPSKRIAIIRSNLKTKFMLHHQGGARVVQTLNKAVGEMDARMVVCSEVDDASEGGFKMSSHPPKQTRALVYTGDLGRPWRQIVEDAVMHDFRCTIFARKDSIPYLRCSKILSVEAQPPGKQSATITGRGQPGSSRAHGAPSDAASSLAVVL